MTNFQTHTGTNPGDGQATSGMPGAAAHDITLSCMPDNPASLLHESLFSNDAYKDQTYWANLPRREQLRSITVPPEQSSKEAARDCGED